MQIKIYQFGKVYSNTNDVKTPRGSDLMRQWGSV